MIRIYSFDVFDTCLTRRVAVPSAVFYEVARKVFEKLGILSNPVLLEDFVAARNKAEHIAHQQKTCEEVTLEEIWRILAQLMDWQYDNDLILCELHAEAASIVPVISILEQVQAARQRGYRILFISDMYLPSEFIKEQLERHGFALDGDGLYVSSEIGKTKASGNLFRYIMAHENISASWFWHIGDNWKSDYIVPRSLGIRATLFTETILTQAEVSLLRIQDFMAATRIPGEMRAFRLGCESEKKKDIVELTSQFIAPFVMGFATWVLQRAQEDGVKRLYFLSRDGQLVWKVARVLSAQFGGIDCRYLYVSRRALSLPSSGTISPEGMPWMRQFWEDPLLKYLLAKIELKFEDIEPLLGALAGNRRESYRLSSEEDWTYFWRALNHEPIKTRINSLISTRRKAARRYFETAGLFESVSCAVVDFGWVLNSQEYLKKLFESWGRAGDIRGYYVGLKNHRLTRKDTGLAEGLFYQHAFDFTKEGNPDEIFNHHWLLEAIVGCADHPTVHFYEMSERGEVRVSFGKAMSETTLRFCRDVHDEVLDFVDKNQILIAFFRGTEICRETLMLLAANFFKNPTARAVNAIRGLSEPIDDNSLNFLPIVKPLNLRLALIPLLPKIHLFAALRESRNSHWYEGSLAITPLIIRQLSKSARRLAIVLGKLRRRLTLRVYLWCFL